MDIEPLFKGLLVFFSGLILIILAAIFFEMIRSSSLSLKTFGLSFFSGKVWDPVQETYGALPFIYGTLITSFLSLIVAVPISIGIALFLTEWAPRWLRHTIGFLVELLAAIPSVIYGLWGIFVLVPFLRTYLYPPLTKLLGFIPFFEGPFYGPSILSGALILSIMILPTIASISKEVFLAVPQEMREAVLALGGTRWESIQLGVLKMSKSGVIGAIVLGLGRAIGETMAVTMLIGNRPEIPLSIFHPGYSLASVIANEFSEATTPLYLSALAQMGLTLLLITFLLNASARLLVRRKHG
ncbi:MAG: phosphate ABC transporter permease subunit PstC [Deltaproteobacteria bacterium]|nr:phosphate ABC transporter permease subunit PstC [Deltaproteobacteria bacterium]